MIDRKDDEAFWPSYVDLMTSLFIVTLVLFIFSYAALTVERDRLKVSADSYLRLKHIEATIKGLADAKHFKYDPKYKRYVFTEDVKFAIGDHKIDPKYDQFLRETGKDITNVVHTLKADPSRQGEKYLIIIEGMASKDDYKDNFPLSYQRALELYKFWNDEKIVFDPDVCEVIVAGSGTGGVGRDMEHEANNQRFLIQIIPKIAYQQ
jgi:outer membrane protein OmpA-like peptidoglycan-associated protein